MVKIVDAIENGKIVKVTEEYALREGLMILKREEKDDRYVITQKPRKQEEEPRVGFEELRKPLGWKKKQVVAELIDNFHWAVANERKVRNLGRKQAAKDLGISENDLKMIENGVLPSEDFVIINKIQKHYGINLRKDGNNFDQSMRNKLDKDKVSKGIEKAKENQPISGDDIEIIE